MKVAQQGTNRLKNVRMAGIGLEEDKDVSRQSAG
jgi:hypothetical protein